MSDNQLRYPKLDTFYQQYLTDENSARFIESVSTDYNVATLERLGQYGRRNSRRAAILALGFVGDFASNEIMGRALVDSDRAVRLLADHGCREIWQRQGTVAQQALLQDLYRLVSSSKMEEAIDLATRLIDDNRDLGEAWNQRAIAFCHEGEFEAAIEDCAETLVCNRFHFPAAMGMAHCQLQLEEPALALDSFRAALRINPDLDGVRRQVSQLEKIVED